MKPLVHCITNYVAMNITANAVLAVGATPIMSFCPEEMDELVEKCDALLVNIGCLDAQQIEAMRIAVASARKYGKPWLLDPVAVGVTKLRTDVCRELIEIETPCIIRGNKREINVLCDVFAVERKPIDLAKRIGCVVVMSGAEDMITDGEIVKTVSLGDPIMAEVTAMGCTSTAVCAAFRAKGYSNLESAYKAMSLMGRAGEMAARQCSGTGSFQQFFLDNLYTMNNDE